MIRFLTVYILCVWGAVGTAETCGGRYGATDRLIELAYSNHGTLYSGGPDYQSVGPTLEIYRLLSGLPDSGMATPRPGDAEFVDPAGGDFFSPQFVGETMMRVLPRLHDPSFRRDRPEGSTDIEVLLNRLTVIGPYSGWWLTPDAPHLSEAERVIAQYAVDDGLDWVLSVQAASARPFQTSWHLQRHSMPRGTAVLMDHAAQRYQATGSLTWFTATHVVREGGIWNAPQETQAALTALDSRFTQLRRAVADCSATPAEYAAVSIATYERLRFNPHGPDEFDNAMDMPPVLRRMAAIQLAKLAMTRRGRYGNFPSHEELQALAGDPAFAPWNNVGRSIRANDIDALIAIHQGVSLDPKTYRLLNLLSVDDLLLFAASRDDGSDDQRALTTAAFLRLYALGRDAEAADLVDDLQRLWPEWAQGIREVWDESAPQEVRLARVALSLPDQRTLIVPPRNDNNGNGAFVDTAQSDYRLEFWFRARRSRDLPISIRTGGFLTRDLSIWMRHIGSNPYAMYSASRRTYRRGIIERNVMDDVTPPVPQSGGYYYGLGIAGFADWDELAQLGPQTGLANRIGREIVQHARLSTDTIIKRLLADREMLARELELVVQQGRVMIHGEMHGKPLGQVAFELLHDRFARTEAAARTPYWFICRERCEP